jgi:cell division protein FtsL
MTPPVHGDAVTARAGHVPGPAPLRDEPAGRHLRVVDEKTARRDRQIRRGIWLFGLVSVASVFVVVAFHVMVAQSQLQLDRLTRQASLQQQRYERLRLDVAALSAPPRIAKRAEELGMKPGGLSTFITVPDSSGPTSIGSSSKGPERDSTSSTADYQKVKQHLGTRP